MSFKIFSAVLVLQFVNFSVPLPTEIPSYIQICSQSDPKLGACIRKSVTSLKPYLIKGIPELDVPPLDPLFVPEISIDQAGGVNVSATFTNISIYGAGDFRLRNIRTEMETNKMRIKLWYPQLSLAATYNISGLIISLPIQGTGSCWGNFTDIDGSVSVQLERVMKNGQEHFKTKYMKIEFNIGGAHAHLYNLFNDANPDLSRTVNHFINENWRMVTAEIRPDLEKKIATLLTEVSDKFFDVFPINKLFKP